MGKVPRQKRLVVAGAIAAIALAVPGAAVADKPVGKRELPESGCGFHISKHGGSLPVGGFRKRNPQTGTYDACSEKDLNREVKGLRDHPNRWVKELIQADY